MNKEERVIPKLLSISQAANEANVSQFTIRDFVNKGKVKYIKSGKKYLINRDSLIEYLTNGDME